jgi:hypothetical protein
MQFILSDSPFRNFFKYDSDNIFDFLVPIVRDFCSVQHEENDIPVPPSAFVLRKDRGEFFNGYKFQDSEEFTAALEREAESAVAIVTLSELGSMSQDFSQGLALICVQTRMYYCCGAFDLSTLANYDIFEDPLRIEIPIEDPSEGPQETTCHLLGMEGLLHPFFLKRSTPSCKEGDGP